MTCDGEEKAYRESSLEDCSVLSSTPHTFLTRFISYYSFWTSSMNAAVDSPLFPDDAPIVMRWRAYQDVGQISGNLSEDKKQDES